MINSTKSIAEELLDLNKLTLYNKLDAVERRNNLIVANDLIDVISNSKERDKQLINEYSDEFVVVYTIKREKFLRKMRFFTQIGLNKFLHEGRIYDYVNTCKYFAVEPKDLTKEKYSVELSKMLDTSSNRYSTNKLLKWLFEKRKMCKELSDTTTIDVVIKKFEDDPDVCKNKLIHLKAKLTQLLPIEKSPLLL